MCHHTRSIARRLRHGGCPLQGRLWRQGIALRGSATLGESVLFVLIAVIGVAYAPRAAAQGALRCRAPLWTALADIVPAPYAVTVAPGIDLHTVLTWHREPEEGCPAPAAWTTRLREATASAGLAVIVGPTTERVLIFPARPTPSVAVACWARPSEQEQWAHESPQARIMRCDEDAQRTAPDTSRPAPAPVADESGDTGTVASAQKPAAPVSDAVEGLTGRRGSAAGLVWQIGKGELMSAALTRWASRAGWTVEWYAKNWPAPASVRIQAKTFLEAAREWTQSAVSNGAPIRVDAKSGNRVLVVESTIENEQGF